MAGTTCSSGLNSLLSGSKVTQTTLPNWYTTAQQNLVNMAGSGAANAPTNIGQTTAQNAVNKLNAPTNAFSTATNALGTIAQGAANPFSLCASTGQMTPNTGTPLGGLFAAQRQQLCQLLPQTLAPVQACGIGSGNFGSLRSQTALNTAKTNAFDTLAAQQMQSALQNQATGATAGGALGNVGAQCVAANLNTGTAQLNAPFLPASNYSSIINAINAPKTCTTQCQLSPLTAINTLAGTPAVLCKLATSVTGTGPGTLRGLYCSIFGSSAPGNLTCAALKTLPCGRKVSSCGNLIVCQQDKSKCFSGALCTATSTGATGAACVTNAAQCYYGPTFDPTAGWSI